MRWRQGRIWAVAVGVLAAGCSHVRERMEVAVATDDGPVVCGPDGQCHDHAKVCKHPTVHALAYDLDHLEKHIECYGSVVAKVPDVWGQARLTQYREDFEREMHKDLDQFEVGLQGSYSRSDQSYLAFAMSLGLAVQPRPPAVGSVSVGDKSGTAAPPPPVLTEVVKTTNVEDKAAGTKSETKETSKLPPEAAPPKGPEPVKVPEADDPQGLVTGADKVIKRNDAVVTSTKFAYAEKGIGIEPAERLAQKKRYLDLLAQFRRENEGSDTADAPGYQLNLMRLPVSVLPGSHTDRGHGAEITFTIDPVLGEDLLPVTFRRMVVNDVVQQLGFYMTRVLEDPKAQPTAANEAYRYVLMLELGRTAEFAAAQLAVGPQPAPTQPPTTAQTPADWMIDEGGASSFIRSRMNIIGPGNTRDGKGIWLDFQKLPPLQDRRPQVKPPTRSEIAPKPATTPMPGAVNTHLAAPAVSVAADDLVRAAAEAKLKTLPPPLRTIDLAATAREAREALTRVKLNSLPFSTTGGGRPFPVSDMVLVYGPGYTYEIAHRLIEILGESIKRQKYAHLPDVQSALRDETVAAYEMLAQQPHLLGEFAQPPLVAAIRQKDAAALQRFRQQFRERVRAASNSEYDFATLKEGQGFERLTQFSVTAALAWAIIVDSALLNDKLMRDMRESATAKGVAPPCPADAWPQFFLPDPPPDARQMFACYVKTRWPIYVFALDPMAQEQNIADSLSTRRETQLALAAAFANGAMNAKAFLNAARRLEAEYQTIALNRTQVGFAHGENTFGWRFYPRFQTPPTQSNLTVFVRDNIIGGPGHNALLRQRRLEPGPRECVALVIMPSFVPYVTVDAVSNWFRLPDPKCKLFDHTQAVKLSKTVRTLETCGAAVTDAACYRDHELKRLQTRVQQLANRLPAQTLTVPVPVVNTLGGFEMFSNGTTDLAPELYGWYGAPGVSADDKDTTLFLVGDHFSPLQTRVIVGNTEITKDVPAGTAPGLRMISRQVMQVTVPKGKVVPVVTPEGRFAQAHVATPYGVSRELLIPYLSEKPAETAGPKPGYTVPDKTTLTIAYGVDGRGAPAGLFRPHFQGAGPARLRFTWHDPLGQAPDQVEVRVRFAFRGATLTVPCRCKVTAATTGDNEVVIDGPAVKALGCELVRQIRDAGWLPLADNPLAAGLASTEVLVTPVRADRHTHAGVRAAGQLAVVFRAEGLCPGKDDCPCDGCLSPAALGAAAGAAATLVCPPAR